MSNGGAALEIRLAARSDLAAILELMRMSLGEGRVPRSEAFFRWKHEQSPFGSSVALVALEEGRVVGLRAFLRWEWTSGGLSLRAVRAVDTATHPNFRGRGIFRKLTLELVERMRDEGVGFIFNTPNEQSRPGYLKMGWRDVTRVPLWVRLGKPLRSRLRPGAARDDEACVEGRATLAEALADERLDALLEGGATNDVRLHTRATRAYLAWRYLHIPGFVYGARATLVGDAPALVVYRRRQRGRAREATVLEVLCARSARGVAVAAGLLRRLAAEADVDYLAASAAPRTRQAAALLIAGFAPLGARGPRLTALPLTRTKVSPLAAGAWRASAGDLELF